MRIVSALVVIIAVACPSTAGSAWAGGYYLCEDPGSGRKTAQDTPCTTSKELQKYAEPSPEELKQREEAVRRSRREFERHHPGTYRPEEYMTAEELVAYAEQIKAEEAERKRRADEQALQEATRRAARAEQRAQEAERAAREAREKAAAAEAAAEAAQHRPPMLVLPPPLHRAPPAATLSPRPLPSDKCAGADCPDDRPASRLSAPDARPRTGGRADGRTRPEIRANCQAAGDRRCD